MITDQALKKVGNKHVRANQSQSLEASVIDAEPLPRAVSDLAKEIEAKRPANLWNDCQGHR